MPGSHTVAVLTTLALIIAGSQELFSLFAKDPKISEINVICENSEKNPVWGCFGLSNSRTTLQLFIPLHDPLETKFLFFKILS